MLTGVRKIPDRTWVMSIIAISLVFFVLPTVRNMGYLLAAQIEDDAFYYLKIAWNISRGYGPTFDGIHLTNGYQPLWLLSLIPLFSVFHNGGDLAARAVFVLQAAFAAVSTGILFRILRTRFQKLTCLFATLAWVSWNISYSVNGLETSLYNLVLTWTILVYMRRFWSVEPYPTWRDHLLLGLGISLSFLARLDSILFTLPIMFSVLQGLWSDKAFYIQHNIK